MDPVILAIGGGLTTAVVYLFRRMERSEDRCIAENQALRARMDEIDRRHAAERAEVLGDLASAMRDLAGAVRHGREIEPLPHDDPNGIP